jgi:hypothetical protein
MRKMALWMVFGMMVLSPSQALAAYIVDTGPGWEEMWGVSIYNRMNGDVQDFQFNAGQFTIGQAYTVTSIETWMYSATAGTVELVLYGDDGDLPDPSNEILRRSFDVAAPGPVTDWQGLTGLGQTLDPGSYWISLEKSVITNDFSVNLPSGASNPLDRHAYRAEEDNGGDWTPYTGHQGFRVAASPAGQVIPEPSAVLLFSAGLLHYFAARKRTREKKFKQ